MIFSESKKILTILALTALALTSNAQTLDEFLGSGIVVNPGSVYIFLKLTPENPKPNQDVIAEIETNSINLQNSEIAWFINGELVKSGFGQHTLSFNAGRAGVPLKLNAVIKTTDETIIDKEITITPSSVELLWQAKTAVPPFYKGKALYSTMSKITVAAVPSLIGDNGLRIDPKDLIYRWKKDGKAYGSLSGYGRQSITFTDAIYRTPFNVEVVVASRDGNQVSSGEIFIDSVQPKILVYEDNPVYGILYNKNLGSQFNLTGQEISLSAFPYYFESTYKNDPKIEYFWSMNGNEMGNGRSTVTLRNSENLTGIASLSVEAQNSNKFFEAAIAGFSIVFGNQR